MEVVLFIGIPASGKSSFYRERFAGSHLRINRDMLKTRHRELSLYQWCLEHDQSCVIDNTNSTREVRTPWLRPAQERGLKVTGYFFQSRIQDCLERNRQRRGAARIPDAGVRDHHARLELPSLEEGALRLHDRGKLHHHTLAPCGLTNSTSYYASMSKRMTAAFRRASTWSHGWTAVASPN